VYLHKPLLSLPVVGQFEQVLNALYLEQLGYGMYAKALDGAVLRRVPLARAEVRRGAEVVFTGRQQEADRRAR